VLKDLCFLDAIDDILKNEYQIRIKEYMLIFINEEAKVIGGRK